MSCWRLQALSLTVERDSQFLQAQSEIGGIAEVCNSDSAPLRRIAVVSKPSKFLKHPFSGIEPDAIEWRNTPTMSPGIGVDCTFRCCSDPGLGRFQTR
jgi:hypothetical protein